MSMDWELIAAGRNYAAAIAKDRGFESGLTDCLRGLSDALEAVMAERDSLRQELDGVLKMIGDAP